MRSQSRLRRQTLVRLFTFPTVHCLPTFSTTRNHIFFGIPGQVLSEAESGAPAAPGDPKNLVAQMALMLERKAQIQSGNPAVIHPATFTYRKARTLGAR